jgi:hypothetical protein
MRLPAVAIAAALACGIVLGLHPAVGRNAFHSRIFILSHSQRSLSWPESPL